MFYAFSLKLNKPVSISDVHDLNETFNCLNPECPAEFYIRSPDGHNSKQLVIGKLLTNIILNIKSITSFGSIFGYKSITNFIQSSITFFSASSFL